MTEVLTPFTERIQPFTVYEVKSFTGTNQQSVALSMPGIGLNPLEDF
jgi:hypothetical protein